MKGHNLHIELSEEEERFLRWLAKRDEVTLQRELQMIFWTEFEECKRLYMEEMNGEV